MKQTKFILAAGLVMVLAALMVSPAAAGGPVEIIAHSVTITGINCVTGQVTGSVAFSITGNNADKHTVAFSNTSTGAISTPHTDVPHTGSATESFSANVGPISSMNTITITSTLENTSFGILGSSTGSAIVSTTTTANCISGSGGGGGIVDDGRLTLTASAAAVIYCSDEGGITIYQASKSGKVGQVMHVTAAELAALPAKPATNTLIKKVGNVSLYKLTTGEYQVNVGPDSEGKTQVWVWRGCNRNTIYWYELQASSHAPYALMGGWQTL